MTIRAFQAVARGPAALFVLVWIPLLASPAWAQLDAAYAGAETCMECHDEVGARMADSVHGRLAAHQYPTEVGGCEGCHGPGAAHAESTEPADILVPRAEDGVRASDSCTACHRAGTFMDWAVSNHASADIACVSCHSIHADNGQEHLLAQSSDALCTSCHQGQTAGFQLPSHHPLKEGFMGCDSCHDPHTGNWTGQSFAATSRDLCVSCHNQYHGPFIFEHAPVEEDCGICHDPHGTVANNLLRQNEPFLCLQCHQPHFHSGLEAIDGAYSTPDGVLGMDDAYAGLSGVSEHDSFKRVMLTKCSQCHQAIHGTDLPSQSIPGQGRALTR